MLNDLRYAFRTLLRSPGFTVVAVLTLALGIGMTTAIFSVVDAVLLRPVPFTDIGRLVMVWETDRASGTTHEPASLPDFLDFKARSRRVGDFAAVAGGEANLNPESGEPVRVAVLNVTQRFFPMLGVEPTLGRTFTVQDDSPGGARVVLISEALWQRQFQRDASVIGRTVRLNERPWTVIGVVPSSADFGILQLLRRADYSRGFAQRDARTTVDIFAPLQGDPQSLPRTTHPIFVLGRLAPGATRDSAQEELGAIAADLEKTYPENEARGVHVQALGDVIFGPTKPALLILMAAVALVLLIACVNVIHLLLARATVRVREVAVRRALGAATGRLVRQFVVENAMLLLASATLGVAVASSALKILLLAAPADIPRLSEVTVDARVVVVALAISITMAFVFGLVPLAQVRRRDLQAVLKASDGRGVTAGRETALARSALMAGEIALAVVLTVGAGLLIQSFWRLQQVNPGFDANRVLKAEFQLPSTRYPTNFSAFPNFKEIQQFNVRLLAAVAALPGVESAALAANHPLDAGFTNSFAVVGRETEARDWPEISVRRVSPGYFSTLRIPLVRGRLLAESDDAVAPPVVLINEASAKRFFSGLDPVGQRINMWGADRTIVGVVGDEKIHGLREVAPIALYMPLSQAPDSSVTLIARASVDPRALTSSIRAAVRQIDPALAVFGLEPLEETLAQSTGEQRFMMLLVGVFAILALTLAVIGIHGVLSYMVAQHRREIGIRVALGAEPGRVALHVLGQGLRQTALGLFAGVCLALILAQSLSGLLFGVTATDLSTVTAVVLLLGLVSVLAMWLPARRASRVDPIVALRYE